MEQAQPLSLIDRLKDAADAWCKATGRTLGALSTLATNQGSFFDRLGSSRAGATVATLEKFARVLGDPANWPDGSVPGDVSKFAHDVGGSAVAPVVSPDTDAEFIGHNSEHESDGTGGASIADPAGPSGRSPGAEEREPVAIPPESSAPGDLFAAGVLRGAA